MSETPRRRWLRAIGLLGLAVTLAVGQPMVTVATTFAILTFLLPGSRLAVLALAALGFVVVFSGSPQGGLWYLERGWAIIVGGGFAAVTLWLPDRPFLPRALAALAFGVVASGLALWVMGGWAGAEALVNQRIQAGAAAAMEGMGGVLRGDLEESLVATVSRTVALQSHLFPALLALSTVAATGVAWWLHQRLLHGSDESLGALKDFRFGDPLVWIFVAGVVLVVLAGSSTGWGRVGSNLLAFMAGLYILRGAGVVLFLSGGMSLGIGVLLVAGLVLAGPLVLAASMLLGLGDSWFDIRARVSRE